MTKPTDERKTECQITREKGWNVKLERGIWVESGWGKEGGKKQISVQELEINVKRSKGGFCGGVKFWLIHSHLLNVEASSINFSANTITICNYFVIRKTTQGTSQRRIQKRSVTIYLTHCTSSEIGATENIPTELFNHLMSLALLPNTHEFVPVL